MATNEELSIAFLCLASRQQQNDLIEFVKGKYPMWYESEHGKLFQEAVALPFSEIPRKIAKLGVSLYSFENKNSIYTWMADQCAALCAGARSPFPIPTIRKKDAHSDPYDWVMPLNLGLPQKQ